MTNDVNQDLTIHREVEVPVEPQVAFEIFTQRMTEFWPSTHRIGSEPFEAVVIEPRIGGRWYERAADGNQCDWGQVIRWDPPTGLTLTWQITADWRFDAELETEIDVSFAPQESGTCVRFTHHNLQRYGEHAADLMAVFESPNGWSGILNGFVQVAGS